MTLKQGLLLLDLKENSCKFLQGIFLPMKFFMPILFNRKKCDCPFNKHLLNSTFFTLFCARI
jgi:hypothetical protein